MASTSLGPHSEDWSRAGPLLRGSEQEARQHRVVRHSADTARLLFWLARGAFRRATPNKVRPAHHGRRQPQSRLYTSLSALLDCDKAFPKDEHVLRDLLH